MTTKKKSNLFQPGKSGNAEGRPKTGGKGTGKPISSLRSTLNKLKAYEPEAVEVIGKVLSGDQGDLTKEQIEMAKWVLARLESYTRSAISEESFKLDVREKENVLKATGTDDGAPKPARFTTHIIQDDE